MSEADAAFIAERHRADIVALSREEKELMSRFLERHFSWIFPSQVSSAVPHLPTTVGNISTSLNKFVNDTDLFSLPACSGKQDIYHH